MRTILGASIAAAAVVGSATVQAVGGGCGGMYSASLELATEESAPLSTPAGGATAATGATTKPILTDQGGG